MWDSGFQLNPVNFDVDQSDLCSATILMMMRLLFGVGAQVHVVHDNISRESDQSDSESREHVSEHGFSGEILRCFAPGFPFRPRIVVERTVSHV